MRLELFLFVLCTSQYHIRLIESLVNEETSLLFDDLSITNRIVRRSANHSKCGNDLVCAHSGKCHDKKCHCTENFTGYDCRIARCNHGWCSTTGGTCKNKKTCQCKTRYGGIDCSGIKCGKRTTATALICFNGATCKTELGICNCRHGYVDNGSGCLTEQCSNGHLCYTNNGHCTSAGCKCRENDIDGLDCSRKICGKSGLICHNGASCIDGNRCQCLHGWKGIDCNTRECPGYKDLSCYGNTCPPVGQEPHCHCPNYTRGEDCSGIVCGSTGVTCYNGGKCDSKTAKCICLPGFGGSDCRATQCTGFSTLFCYNGGCPTAGRDIEANCICKDPFTGSDCSQMACSHSAVTCYNGGECIDGQSCKCPPGYGGIDCRGVRCGSEFCYNHGECVKNGLTGTFHCNCSGNYTLSDCSGEKCSDNGLICRNQATCEKNENGNFSCQCDGEWAGKDCSATPCLNTLCYNGGFCDDDGKGKDGCVCVNGWLGHDCRAKSCGPHGLICHNGGVCLRNSESVYTCQCEKPWLGPTCQEQYCGTTGLICRNSGVCSLNTVGHTSPACVCPPGFTGDDCSAVTCGNESVACFNGGRCNEATGTCICPPPLTSDDCRGNICGAGTTNSIVCQNDGICVLNEDDEWMCNCTNGWSGPYCMLRVCDHHSSSSLICAHEGTCVRSPTTGSYTCACQPHWGGVDCSGMRCTNPDIICYNQVDYDPKICSIHGCDCLNDGYGADCRGVQCGSATARCYNGAMCIDFENNTCSKCPAGFHGKDCSQMECPGVPSGFCFNGGICNGGSSCLCGLRSDWSGPDCSQRLCTGNYICHNNGLCTDAITKQCICPPSFTGKLCTDHL